jgi:ribosomal protein S18 acetylase RimI-like enzyme
MVEYAPSHDGDLLRAVIIRRATQADIPNLVRLRRMMFEGMGWEDHERLVSAQAASAAYLAKAIPSGEFYGWVAVVPTGKTVSTGGIIIDQHLPTPGNLSGKIGYVLNVATDPHYRRRGIARRIMQTMLAWLAEKGIRRAVLHASDQGWPLYESLGFKQTANEMRLEIGE